MSRWNFDSGAEVLSILEGLGELRGVGGEFRNRNFRLHALLKNDMWLSFFVLFVNNILIFDQYRLIFVCIYFVYGIVF